MKLFFTNFRKKSTLIVFILGFVCTTHAQDYKLLLKNKKFIPESSIQTFNWQTFSTTNKPFNGKYFVLIQFTQVPNQSLVQQLGNKGITLLNYVPNYAYTAIITQKLTPQILQQLKIRSIFKIDASFKIQSSLLKQNMPAWAVKQIGTVDVVVNISKAVTIGEAKEYLLQKNYTIENTDWSNYHVLTVRTSQQKIEDLASIPFIEYVEPIAPEAKDLNNEMRNNARANMLNAPLSAGGEGLNGSGVTIGIGDNGAPVTHIDTKDRIINRSAGLFKDHTHHVSGIMAGAGIKEELLRGMAAAATLVSSLHYGILQNAATFVADYAMMATNNSWGYYVGDCDIAGTYDTYSRMTDLQAFELPNLLHVFAVGNDGSNTCPGYATGFHTALAANQSAKNDIVVGWGDKDYKISPGSSFGPVNDGRLKPEICATGSDVNSTYPNNNYSHGWGSSMASPNVAGAYALLVEKFRQLNSGANPKSALMKALLMNGANDVDNPGPDYKTGYGWLHLPRSLDMMKNNRYINTTIAQAATNTHTITVPANTAQLKVMVYWHDPAASVFATQTLVNDIDLEVQTPASSTILPWKLDTIPANVYNNATRGAEHINNHEQVTIDNPTAGTYTIKIKGTAINAGPTQEYFVVYDFLPTGLFLTFPKTGFEPLVPGETAVIVWDAWGLNTNTSTLQYSIDNGANWITIDAAVITAAKRYEWIVPNIVSSTTKVRIQQNSTAYADVSNAFTVVAQPTLNVSAVQCEGYFAIDWTTVTGATDYEVMWKQGTQMQSVTTTNATNYTFSGLNKDSIYWVSVRARVNGKTGRRATAVQRKPNDGTCVGNISNGDLKLDSIISPNTGRKYTSTEIASTNLVVRIKNLDDAPISNFDVKYSLNGGSFVSQNITLTIPAGGTYTHTFSGLNFSAVGNYNIVAVVKNTAGDLLSNNDTLRRTIRQIANDTMPLAYHAESFDTAPVFEIKSKTMGLPNLDKWDFESTTTEGRVRSFVNTGMALNGTRALNLDASNYIATGNTNYLTGTFNLGGFSGIFSDELGLCIEFWYKHHNQIPNADNRVWARKSDTSPWVQIYNLDSAQGDAGVWKRSGTIHIDRTPALQPISSSFQVRFGQNGVIQTGDDTHNRGISIDSFKLFTASQDFELVSIDTPVINGCSLSSSVPLKVFTKNYRGIPAPVPIKFRLDGGAIITETAYLGGSYTFTNTLNLSAPGIHTLDVWVDFFQDYNKTNDSIIGYKIYNQPTISTFPYLEDFENGAGNWYANGKNSSWQLGTPSSIKIKKAASGSKAFKTTLAGQYKDYEKSYLYSPCFNTSGLSNPYLSCSVALDMEQCSNPFCDAAWVEYTLDGKTWSKLGTAGQGTNWYNNATDNVWDTAGFTRWHTASIGVPASPQLQLRFVMQSDEGGLFEGIAIDDIHIYNLQYPIYTNTTSTPITQTISGNTWQHFVSGGKVMASINTNNTNLGSTAVQSYIHTGGASAIRVNDNQYYHDRNITIKPTNTALADSATVRFYFTDAEVDTLSQANGCITCTGVADAYVLGVTKYSNTNTALENGTLADNVGGNYSYLIPNKVKKVPYDAGYYAEFKVKNFSEFWLNNGGVNNNAPLPLQLLRFTATRQNANVLLQWNTANEQNVDRYEIEICRGNADYQQLKFYTLGFANASNGITNTYSYNDVELGKNEARYYRLKMIDKNGAYKYSDIKVMVFGNGTDWVVYPNPVKTQLQVITQANAGEVVTAKLINNVGQILLSQTFKATGYADKTTINIAPLKLSAGVYMLQLMAGDVMKVVKVVKE
jgi:Subtilase family/Secretion system C-terminal sorting domain